MYYDRKGNEINHGQWSDLFDDENYHSLVKDYLPDGTMVSTVWLGLDHGIRGDGDPVIFETMVFSKTLLDWDQSMERYSTEEEAIAGHKRILACVKSDTDVPTHRTQ